jgi:alkanesulfonate monooxygenase SsuD/methylene tetrahydromethanopterin reductase-like flavin-dependent oxidoreductase (luciferase family)
MAGDRREVHGAGIPRHRFGLHLTDFAHPAWAADQLLPRLSSVCQALEGASAFDTLWLNEHLHHLGPEGPGAPRPESLMLLAAAAMRTSTLRLGLLVASVSFRHAALLVKMVGTLDVLSRGRAVLGLGAGHPRTAVEHRTYGIPFPPPGERMDHLEHALQLTRAMLRGEGPPNVQATVGPLPVMVGGSGEQRLLRLVARYADMCNFSAQAGDGLALIPHKLEVLKRHCEAVGRDRREITVTYKSVMVVGDREEEARQAWDAYRAARGLLRGASAFVGASEQVARQVAAFLDAGVDEVIVELPEAHDPGAIRAASKSLEMAAQAAHAAL